MSCDRSSHRNRTDIFEILKQIGNGFAFVISQHGLVDSILGAACKTSQQDSQPTRSSRSLKGKQELSGQISDSTR